MPLDFYFFKFTQPLTVSSLQLKEKGGKPNRKPCPFPYGLRDPYGNLKSENSQDYAQQPQQKYTFMDSASGNYLVHGSIYTGTTVLGTEGQLALIRTYRVEMRKYKQLSKELEKRD